MGKVVSCVVLIAAAASNSVLAAPKLANGISVFSIEADSGLVLLEHNSDVQRPPASMIKIMQMLLVVEGVERGDWSLSDPITASRHAQRMGGTQVFLHEGETHPLGHLMLAVAVASANDAAMAVAEGLWGSEDAYLEAMNVRARELGMTNSEFHSVHGLPPDRGESPDQTTARDMATLARACVAHEQILEWTSIPRLVFRPGDAIVRTTNALIGRMPECDGLKTGYIRKAGFCIAATAERNGIRIVTVVMGHENKDARFNIAEHFMLEGLSSIRKDRVLIRDVAETPTVRVANSEALETRLAIAHDLWATALKSEWEDIKVVLDFPHELTAPLQAAAEVGVARVELNGSVLGTVPLITREELVEAGWLWKTGRAVRSFFGLADD